MLGASVYTQRTFSIIPYSRFFFSTCLSAAERAKSPYPPMCVCYKNEFVSEGTLTLNNHRIRDLFALATKELQGSSIGAEPLEPCF